MSYCQTEIITWHLEDELSGLDHPKKEAIKRFCEMLNLPFDKKTSIAIIYGDNQIIDERLYPQWLKLID